MRPKIQSSMKKIITLFFLAAFFACHYHDAQAQWLKYEGGPVLGGGDLGTIFDIFVLKDGKEYIMYSSWRPKKICKNTSVYFSNISSKSIG